MAAARAAVGPRGRVVALAFDPSPLTVLRPQTPHTRLSTFDQRARWLMQAGASEVVRIAPTREFLQQDAQAFIERLVREHRPRFIVEGPDFRFGRDRAGSIETLRQLEPLLHYRLVVVEPVEVALSDQSIVRASSSLARWLVGHGRMRDVTAVLGRPFEIHATVERGDQRGRTIGFPTANLRPAFDQLLPADGVYAGFAERDGSLHPAAISVGDKPTFGRHARTCEAFLLDYHGPVDDYDWTIHLRFTHWLRDQLKYDGVDALIWQLHRDAADARRFAAQAPGTSVSAASIACARTAAT
jgi:riboflavin kinase/FMN adenylyltransferase